MLETLSNCPKCGKKKKFRLSSSHRVVIGLGIIILLGRLASTDSTDVAADKKVDGLAAVAVTPKQESNSKKALREVLLDYKWRTVGFSSVMEADFTVINQSAYEIKDIVVECQHYAKSGTKIDSNEKTIFDVIPAGSKKIFKKFSMGFIHSQAEATNCFVKAVTA